MSTKTITIKSLLVNNTSNDIETIQQNVLTELNKVIAKHEKETGLVFDSIQFNESANSINVNFKTLN
jgi:hypothetical protein